MYLASDHWRRAGRARGTSRIEFFNAGAVLFGVKDYVPALMRYIERYGATLNFNAQPDARRRPGAHGLVHAQRRRRHGRASRPAFDMIHVVPPQRAPDFVRGSRRWPMPRAGWRSTRRRLRHKRFPGIYGLGDACIAPNAKTAAAARKQAPVVAHNLLPGHGRDHGAERGL